MKISIKNKENFYKKVNKMRTKYLFYPFFIMKIFFLPLIYFLFCFTCAFVIYLNPKETFGVKSILIISELYFRKFTS